jgi:hypothetical protein
MKLFYKQFVYEGESQLGCYNLFEKYFKTKYLEDCKKWGKEYGFPIKTTLDLINHTGEDFIPEIPVYGMDEKGTIFPDKLLFMRKLPFELLVTVEFKEK